MSTACTIITPLNLGPSNGGSEVMYYADIPACSRYGYIQRGVDSSLSVIERAGHAAHGCHAWRGGGKATNAPWHKGGVGHWRMEAQG